ncbi:MAG: hypothetical protein JXA25_06685 [Anaerolineales bacterium]|nr:hypothetical protein [Anaerolineales bacterium]
METNLPENEPSYNYQPVLLASILLAAAGWSGLYLLLTRTLPTVLPRWVFFFLLVLASSGTSLPFLWLLHRRFNPNPFSPGLLQRQSLEFSLVVTILTWLQINRTFSLTLALVISVGVVLLDSLLQRLQRTSRRGP